MLSKQTEGDINRNIIMQSNKLAYIRTHKICYMYLDVHINKSKKPAMQVCHAIFNILSILCCQTMSYSILK